MRKSLRYLRIFWTAACGIACVLLVVLWARSDLKWTTVVRVCQNDCVGLSSSWGDITFFKADAPPNEQPGTWLMFDRNNTISLLPFPSTWIPVAKTGNVILPYWFPVLLSTALATAPWIRWRFTTRTLLIATTLVAVVLGVIVWAVR